MKPKNKIQPLMFIAPALLVYIATVIIPIIWSMGYSFFSWNGIRDMKFVGLENYTRMFTDKTFLGAVNKVVLVVVVSNFSDTYKESPLGKSSSPFNNGNLNVWSVVLITKS